MRREKRGVRKLCVAGAAIACLLTSAIFNTVRKSPANVAVNAFRRVPAWSSTGVLAKANILVFVSMFLRGEDMKAKMLDFYFQALENLAHFSFVSPPSSFAVG